PVAITYKVKDSRKIPDPLIKRSQMEGFVRPKCSSTLPVSPRASVTPHSSIFSYL
ncbi:hypothetical protein M407DRAFT_242520, partial [Tulasnella calospora MUT 4182]